MPPRDQFFVLPLPPSDNDRLIPCRNSRRWTLSEEYRKYKEAAALYLKKQREEVLMGPVEVFVTIYRKDRRRDLNSFDKCLFDVLQGVAYQDDKQIIQKHSVMKDSEMDNPRAVIRVRPYVAD